MRRPRRIAEKFSEDDVQRLRDSLVLSAPELGEYDDWQLPHQWWCGLLYVAGFRDRRGAERYGRAKGWL